jgi:hypothetical protein
MGNLSEEAASTIVEQAEERAEKAEAAAAEARRQKREQDRLAELAAEAGMKLAPLDEAGDADEEAVQADDGELPSNEESAADNDTTSEVEPADSAEEQTESAT